MASLQAAASGDAQATTAKHPSPKEQLETVWSTVLKHNCPTKGEDDDSNKNNSARNWPSYDTLLSDLAGSDYNETLQCPHDLRLLGGGRRGKERALCPHGVVCCARLELFSLPSTKNTPYTGLLEPGFVANNCILRLSSAMKPPNDEIKSKIGRALLYATGEKLRNAKLFPTAALKVFRDNGAQSGNLLFAGCKVGQHEEDFFAHCLCTQLTERMPRTVKPFVRKFWQYSDYPLSLGISEFCTTNEKGETVGRNDIHFPYILILSPCYGQTNSNPRGSTSGVPQQQDPEKRRQTFFQFTKKQSSGGSSSNKTEEDGSDFASFDSFLDDVLSIPAGTVLYDVFACPDPESVPDPSKLQRIGRLVTTSAMIQSGSDDGLFFRHQQKEEDYELRPGWKESAKAECSLDNGKVVGAVSALAGWKLFEEHIKKGTYVDFETLSED